MHEQQQRPSENSALLGVDSGNLGYPYTYISFVLPSEAEAREVVYRLRPRSSGTSGIVLTSLLFTCWLVTRYQAGLMVDVKGRSESI